MKEFTERQQQIVEQSLELIAKGGIQNLTIRNLSQVLNITEPAIYRHFPDKMAILKAILGFFRTQLNAEIETINKMDLPVFKKLEQTITGLFSRFSKSPALVTVIFAEGMFQNSQELSHEVLRIMEARRLFIEMILRQGRKSGEIRKDVPVRQQALLIMGGMRLTVTRWRLGGGKFNLEAEGRKFCSSLQTLLQPNKGDV